MVSRVVRSDVNPVVVCVDDDPQVLTAMKRLLRREPVDLRTTEKPEKALQWLGEGGVRLLITDLRMPDMDGNDLIRVVEERFPETQSLILTGYPGQRSPGKPRLLTKPWDDAELKDIIRELVQPMRPDGPDLGTRRGRVLILGADERLRAGLSRETFEFVGGRGGAAPAEVVLLDADSMAGPLQIDTPGAVIVVLATNPRPDEIGAWYAAGVGQVLRKPVSPTALGAILRGCVLQARARADEAEARNRKQERLAAEDWTKRARRWVKGRALAPSGSETGRRRGALSLTGIGLLIGILLALFFKGVDSIPSFYLGGAGPDPFSERLLRLSSQDQSLRRWYMQQQLELGRQMNEDTRRYYEDQGRARRWSWDRPAYPIFNAESQRGNPGP
ncbi:MAG: response regulator [Planctomycetaceae bacterium]|nr:response regulator [Planctomycetaceae bacterium]